MVQTIDEDLPQPGQQFPFATALELAEVAVCRQHRVLDEVRGIHPPPQPPVELCGGQYGQIVPVKLQKLAEGLRIAVAGESH